MAEEIINPNWHVIFVHYPLALLTVGILVELFSFIWRRSSIRTAGRWMILLGALLCLPTVTTGIYAFKDAAQGASSSPDGSWQDLVKASSWGNEQWQFMRWHIWLTCIATGVFLVACLVWLACTDYWRDRLRWLFLILLLAGLGTVSAGAWYSGESVYRFGVAVTPPSTPASVTPAAEAGHEHEHEHAQIDRYLPPIQTHLLLVGISLAFAMAALGLTLRRWSAKPIIEQIPTDADVVGRENLLTGPGGAAVHPQSRLPGANKPEPLVAALVGHGPNTRVIEPVPVFPARFWLLAGLVALLTAVAGIWVVEGSDWSSNWKLSETIGLIRDALKPETRKQLTPSQNNLLIHIILGLNIIVLPLILALLTRFSRRLVWITSIGIILLLVAVAGQVWTGVELLYDLK